MVTEAMTAMPVHMSANCFSDCLQQQHLSCRHNTAVYRTQQQMYFCRHRL